MYLEMPHGDGSYEERPDCRRRMYQLSEVCKLVSERECALSLIHILYMFLIAMVLTVIQLKIYYKKDKKEMS